jgi:hypothetical protein
MQGLEHKPTPEQRKLVQTLSAVGVTFEDIASKLEISSDTLVKHYKKELDTGRIDANATVAQSLFQQAKSGNTTAMMFWLKTRARWKEVTQHEISGIDGSSIPVSVGIEFVEPIQTVPEEA